MASTGTPPLSAAASISLTPSSTRICECVFRPDGEETSYGLPPMITPETSSGLNASTSGASSSSTWRRSSRSRPPRARKDSYSASAASVSGRVDTMM